jgi:hypothetical protein
VIGPLHLAQVTTHIGYSPLCICCCPEYGGKQFPLTERPVLRDKDHPFIKFEPLATSITEDAIIGSIEVGDHFDEQSQRDRASVDGLPDKAETSAPRPVLLGLAHQSDLELEEYEFLMLLVAEVA